VPASLVTLPEVLQAHGYATGIFAANAFIAPQFGFAQGVDRFVYNDVPLFERLILWHLLGRIRKYVAALGWVYDVYERIVNPNAVIEKKEMYHIPRVSGPQLNAAFLDWAWTLSGKPFFAYLHYMEPHAPYGAPPPLTTQFDEQGTPASPQMDHPIYSGFLPFVEAPALLPRQLEHLVARYDGEIAYIDQVIGELFQNLRQLGLYDRTVILVTADHGDEFYEHHGWGHGHSLFNELLRVPLIVRYPAVFPQGTHLAQSAQHIDLMPTILELCGIERLDGLSGHSLVGLVRSPGSTEGQVPVYSELLQSGSSAFAVQEGRFKLIEAHSGAQNAWLLFDVAGDPQEQQPLDVNTHPVGPRLKQLLASFRERVRHGAVEPQTVQIDPHTQDQLRALGYLH